MSNYDVVILGAGPGGYVAAIRAAQLGKSVAIIEKEYWGGVCLNIGCIPSKSLLKNAEVAHTLRERGKEFGFSFDNLKLDYKVAFDRSRQVSNRLVKGVQFLMKKNKIAVYEGTGFIKDKNTVEVTMNEGGKKEMISGQNLIVATGASPFVLPGVEVDGERVLTYKEAILQEKLPKSVIIIGAGAIGVEFATIWNGYGVDVTIVEMLDGLVPREDAEVSKELTKAYTKAGINVKTGAKVTEIETLKTKAKVLIETKDGNETLEAEQALMAIAFRPNTEGFGLENIDIELDRGAIKIDHRMATNVPGVWAIGDVTAKLMLAHVGMAQGVVCAENIAGAETVTLDYDMMPRATYSHPQVASFGYTEEQAKEKGYEVKVGKFNFQANGKALGLGDYTGWAKLVTDAKYGEILGAHLIGPEVTELLPELTLAQLMEITPKEIARNVHAHPTLSEVLLEIAEGALGHGIHS